MITPSNPGVSGNGSVEHDGRPDSAHESEISKAEKGVHSVKENLSNANSEAREESEKGN